MNIYDVLYNFLRKDILDNKMRIIDKNQRMEEFIFRYINFRIKNLKMK